MMAGSERLRRSMSSKIAGNPSCRDSVAACKVGSAAGGTIFLSSWLPPNGNRRAVPFTWKFHIPIEGYTIPRVGARGYNESLHL